MKKIPTAEDFMNSKEFEPDSGISFEDYHGDNAAMVPHMMIEFAKMHLKAFQKSMKKVIISNDDLQSDCESGRFDISKVYPLKNIE